MCTDELTTGSLMMHNRERRVLAAKSHAFNISQRRFTQLFPEYAGRDVRDLPNMTYKSPTTPRTGSVSSVTKTKSGTKAPSKADSSTSEPIKASESLSEDGVSAPNPSPFNPRNVTLSVLAVLGCLFTAKLIDSLGRR
mgnify:FL=1